MLSKKDGCCHRRMSVVIEGWVLSKKDGCCHRRMDGCCHRRIMEGWAVIEGWVLSCHRRMSVVIEG